MAQKIEAENALFEALNEHTDTESVGSGGPDKVACWLTADAIKNRKSDVVSNLTILANAHGYDYHRGSLQQSGYMLIFEPVDD